MHPLGASVYYNDSFNFLVIQGFENISSQCLFTVENFYLKVIRKLLAKRFRLIRLKNAAHT
jgi:hypothetical protein